MYPKEASHKIKDVQTSLTLLHVCRHQLSPSTTRSEELRKLTEKVCAADLQVANCSGAARVPWCIICILATSRHQQPGAGQLAILHHPHCAA